MKIKTLLILLAAAFCLTSCIEMMEECTYTIYIEEVSKQVNPDNDSFDAKRVAKTYATNISKVTNSTWVKKIKNQQYKEADEDALKQFEATLATVRNYTNNCQKELNGCTGEGNLYIKFTVWLKRTTSISDEVKEMGAEDFYFSYSK